MKGKRSVRAQVSKIVKQLEEREEESEGDDEEVVEVPAKRKGKDVAG